MPIQIINNGASIKFAGGGMEQLIMKQSVLEISIVGENIIKIGVGEPLTNKYFRQSDVTLPITTSAIELRDLINTMITNCVCHDTTTPPME